jgi:hypothetical protein
VSVKPDDRCASYAQPNHGWGHPRSLLSVALVILRGVVLLPVLLGRFLAIYLFHGGWPEPIIPTLPDEEENAESLSSMPKKNINSQSNG